ncbi:hypothetical protein [Aestuariibaculum sediminum]|uniref:Uncharacterized protein n=1 Tax=Aestuariibaculum sediminum TaxID=2770637 RepID=A0A8J6UBZ0_9FLAO|nr:hypothetical protein [Aestuariibaculum sediminum]MBD0831674.1 hypothetical protein [Aestuariibaculum sediminum]
MLFNTTYKDINVTRQINDLIGKPYSLWSSIKLKGVGSKRMIIDEASPQLKTVLNEIDDINYGNIELRPGGILIHITKGLDRFSWTIPYFHLVIFKSNGISIHSNGKFVHFKKNKTLQENKSFFKKLIAQKIKFEEHHKLNLR